MSETVTVPRGAAQAGGWRTATASLRFQQFRWVYASNLAYFFAMNGQFVVRSYLAFKLTNDNAFALGLVNLAAAVPMLVISPFGGVIADRVERRNLVLAGQAVLFAGELVIMSLLAFDLLEFWHLMAIVFLLGVVMPVIIPARQAIVVDIVGKDLLPNALALTMGGVNAARVAAPVLAGMLIAIIGLRFTYGFALVLYILAFVSMLQVHRSRSTQDGPRKSMLGDLADGFRYVRDDRPVRALMLLSIVPILFAMPFQMLLVVFAEDVWDVGSLGLGTLQAVAGVGGIMGSIYVAWRGETRKRLRLMIATLIAFASSLFLFALSPWFLLALPLVLISDVFASIFTTVNSTAIQLLIPDAVRGRVMALLMMTFGLTPLGTVPVSAAAEAFGAPAAVAGASLFCIMVTVAFYFLSPALRNIDRVSDEAAVTRRAKRTQSEPRHVPHVAEPASGAR